MGIYRTVTELTKAERDELKETYWQQLLDEGHETTHVTDDMIDYHYAGIGFVKGDFFCNL